LALVLVGWAYMLMPPSALAEGTFFKNKRTASATSVDAGVSLPNMTPAEAEPASTQVTPRGAEDAITEEVSGNVDDIPSTDVLIVSGQQVLLAGVRGVRGPQVASLRRWIAANGSHVTCQPIRRNYRCVTSSGKDIGLAVIYMGAGRARQGASQEYLQAQAQARAMRKGVWSRR
jgi:hypothetical protein